MRTALVALFVVASLAVSAAPTRAQTLGVNVNPEAVEFAAPSLARQNVTGYLVELFVAFTDTQRDIPVTMTTLGPDALKGGTVRVDLRQLTFDVPDGRYVATIRPEPGSIVDRSIPSDPFWLKREGTPDDRVAEAKRERFWTRIGVALGAGLLVIPLVF
jgi:hypothetical protein